MNQTAELIVGCFGVVHVIELRDVYKTSMSVYKKGGTAMIRPLHLACEGLFYLQNIICRTLFAEEFIRSEEAVRGSGFGRNEDAAKKFRKSQKNEDSAKKFRKSPKK